HIVTANAAITVPRDRNRLRECMGRILIGEDAPHRKRTQAQSATRVRTTGRTGDTASGRQPAASGSRPRTFLVFGVRVATERLAPATLLARARFRRSQVEHGCGCPVTGVELACS